MCEIYKKNKILACLPNDEIEQIKPYLEPIALDDEDVLVLAGNEMSHFYFISSGVVSLSSETNMGQSIEVAMVGNEGCVGLCMLFGEFIAPLNKMVSGKDCKVLRTPVSKIKKNIDSCRTLNRLLHKYLFKQMTQMSQNLVCTHYHNIEQQVCKWLLLRYERESNPIHITQNKLASLIGVRRAGVTEVISELCRNNLISTQRGVIQIVDEKSLVDRSCECYRIIKNNR